MFFRNAFRRVRTTWIPASGGPVADRIGFIGLTGTANNNTIQNVAAAEMKSTGFRRGAQRSHPG
jgi:hypothetical protein